DDVLKSWFGAAAAKAATSGTLELRPLTSTTSSTSGAPFAGLQSLITFAASRTYNSTSNGTFGQYIPAIPFANFVAGASDPAKLSLLTLQQTAQSSAFHTNLGLVEGSGDPASVLVSVFGDNGHKLAEFAQALKGGQHLQLNSILDSKNITATDARFELRVF